MINIVHTLSTVIQNIHLNRTKLKFENHISNCLKISICDLCQYLIHQRGMQIRNFRKPIIYQHQVLCTEYGLMPFNLLTVTSVEARVFFHLDNY